METKTGNVFKLCFFYTIRYFEISVFQILIFDCISLKEALFIVMSGLNKYNKSHLIPPF